MSATPHGPPEGRPPRCRGCGYRIDLDLPEHRCPECGRDFDPTDPYSYLAGAGRPERPWHRIVRAPALWLIALAPVAGAIDVYYFAINNLIFTSLLVSLCTIAWCAQDGTRRGRRLKRWFIVIAFILPVVFLPIHLIRTRGLRALPGILLAAVLFATAVTLSDIGANLAFAVL